MAMWTSVSVFVEAESVEDINRVVNEIDLSEYYLPKWDVYGTDADRVTAKLRKGRKHS